MPIYSYHAVNRSGEHKRGRMSALNEWALTQYLMETGYEPIRLKIIRPHSHIDRFSTQKPSLRDIAILTAQTNTLLHAGIPFIMALRDIHQAAHNPVIQTALSDIIGAIDHGSRISAAFACHPRLFSSIYISILSAAEHSGDMLQAFDQLTQYTENRSAMREQLIRSLRYPLFLLAIAFGVVTFMMTLVVPQIVQFLKSIDSELPMMTRLLIGASEFFISYWLFFMMIFVAIILFIGLLRSTSRRAATFIDAVLLRMPIFGNILYQQSLALFIYNFALVHQSGLTIPDSLREAKNTLGNHALQSQLTITENRIQSGCALSVAMQSLLPPFALRMLRVGEQSGQLTKSLKDMTIVLDRDVKVATEQWIGSLEPFLTIMVGGILAWIVLAVLGPIYGNLAKLNMMN